LYMSDKGLLCYPHRIEKAISNIKSILFLLILLLSYIHYSLSLGNFAFGAALADLLPPAMIIVVPR
jgi:hypothetical protein